MSADEGLKRLLRATGRGTEQYEQLLDSFLNLLKGIDTVISPAVNEAQRTLPAFIAKLAPLAEAIQRRHEAELECYPLLDKRLSMLADRGWFISYDLGLPEFDALSLASVTTSDSELEQVAEQTYRDALGWLSREITYKFPEREFAISPAVKAHQNGDFALSIPVFLSQTDGICAAKTKKYMFLKGRGGGHISTFAASKRLESEQLHSAKATDDLVRLFDAAIWAPILQHRPIGFNEAQREASGYKGLNRHAVLHGESLDYATEVNSLKAFSLLSYVVSIPIDDMAE
jgi:hypothetical protein